MEIKCCICGETVSKRQSICMNEDTHERACRDHDEVKTYLEEKAKRAEAIIEEQYKKPATTIIGYVLRNRPDIVAVSGSNSICKALFGTVVSKKYSDLNKARLFVTVCDLWKKTDDRLKDPIMKQSDIEHHHNATVDYLDRIAAMEALAPFNNFCADYFVYNVVECLNNERRDVDVSVIASIMSLFLTKDGHRMYTELTNGRAKAISKMIKDAKQIKEQILEIRRTNTVAGLLNDLNRYCGDIITLCTEASSLSKEEHKQKAFPEIMCNTLGFIDRAITFLHVIDKFNDHKEDRMKRTVASVRIAAYAICNKELRKEDDKPIVAFTDYVNWFTSYEIPEEFYS